MPGMSDPLSGSITGRRIDDISGRDGLWGTTLLERKRLLNAPDCIDIDYSRVTKDPAAQQKECLSNLSESEMLRLIQRRIQAKFQNPRKCFVRMLRIGVEKVPHAKPAAQRVSVHEMAEYLQELDNALDAGDLTPIFSRYERSPGEGIDLAAFSDMMSGEPPSVVFERTAANEEMLSMISSKGPNRSTASHVLMKTNASVPQGQYAQYDQTIPLYGCANGLDINNDGSDNGFFVAPPS
eukprot:TRINITY_DN8042_c0_g1_i1.p1 TRINITY_DN8042_c0_g1~~TRINITY_DN8042_c0_g1_i1.p1  ORF type:complete len:238 (+),score=83.65 TRINITY_DN8042_c0_g1_i1:43-756(+)